MSIRKGIAMAFMAAVGAFNFMPAVRRVEDSIKPETTLEDGLEMDSLDVIQAFMLIEDEFDIIVADEEIEPCKTVADIIDLVTKKVGA